MPPSRAAGLAALAGVAFTCTSCFVSLDESLWQNRGSERSAPEQPAPPPQLADAGAAVDALPGATAADAGRVSTADGGGADATADDAAPAAERQGPADAGDGGDRAAGGDDLGTAPAPDASAPDRAAPADRGPACSAAGTPAACDPLTGGGCSAGSCYLTLAGPVCVCPAGAIAKGDPCSTSTQCAPRLVCAASYSKGVCRALCDRAQPSCPAGEWCAAINGVAALGICRP